MGYLDKLDASIEAMLSPAEALARRKQIDEEDRKRRRAQSIVIHRCAEAIDMLANAIRYPSIARSDIEEAIRISQAALEAAKELDK